MDTITRRRFLVASGVTGAGALAAGAVGAIRLSDVHSAINGNPLPAGTPIVVVVTLYGGNDGLSTVIPYTDKTYHDKRPDLAYAAEEVLPLDDELGLNPTMRGFASLWKDNRLAIIRGVGYPKPDLSHFRSMDIWQTASPSTPVNSGWVGRWLDIGTDDPLRAVCIGSVLPPLVIGAKTTAAALDPGREQALQAVVSQSLEALGTAESSDSSSAALVRDSYRAEHVTAGMFDKALAHAPAASGDADDSSLASQLDTVSTCIKAGVPTRLYAVSLGGFDTHADEKGAQSALVGAVDKAVSSFLDGLVSDPHGNNVVVVVYSEFGRRVAANASQGTDHGTAGPVFVAGQPVKGGFYGEQPSLTDLDDGDLKHNVDFRAIYGELIHRMLDTDPTRVLDTVPKELGFIA